MESRHPEGKSPFIVEEGASGSATGTAPDEEVTYAECPVDGCGEIILETELGYHIELHGEEDDDDPVVTRERESGIEANERAGKYHSPYGNQENIPPPSGGSRSRGRPADSKNRQTGSIQKWKQLLAMPSGLKGNRTGPLGADGARKRLGVSSPVVARPLSRGGRSGFRSQC